MKISIAQIESFKGEIQRNIDHHLTFIQRAVHEKVDVIVFPELSLTGYEPELAEALATEIEDSHFDMFQRMSNLDHIIIGVGMPIRSKAGIHIGMILFQPHQERQVYYKQYLHEDELPYFVSGENTFHILNTQPAIAPAICYEISVEEHAKYGYELGAGIYLASVAKFVRGIQPARERLSRIAKTYSQTVLMANCIGMADGEVCGGHSSIWDNEGELLIELNDQEEGLLILDTETGVVAKC